MTAFHDTEDGIEYARGRWEEGEARAQRFSPDSQRRNIVERIIDSILLELEKRIGQTFSSAELAAMHDDSEEWCLIIAHAVAPDDPWAWDLDVVQSAAFYRYARRATDYQMSTAE